MREGERFSSNKETFIYLFLNLYSEISSIYRICNINTSVYQRKFQLNLKIGNQKPSQIIRNKYIQFTMNIHNDTMT